MNTYQKALEEVQSLVNEALETGELKFTSKSIRNTCKLHEAYFHMVQAVKLLEELKLDGEI